MRSGKLKTKLPQRLRQLRTKNKLTQEEAAELAGMDVRHYQKFESKKRLQSPTLDTLERLARAVKTTPSKLIDI